MKKVNFLLNLWRLFRGSQKDDGSTRLRVDFDSLSTRLRVCPLKLVSVFTILLSLGVGNAWGADGTLTIDYDSFSSHGTSYSDKSWSATTSTSTSISGKATVCFTNSENWIQIKNGHPAFRNTTALPGAIKSIYAIRQNQGSNRTLNIYAGTEALDNSNYTTKGTSIGSITVTTSGVTKTFSAAQISAEYTYFYIYGSSNALYLDEIVVTFDASGGGETKYTITYNLNGGTGTNPTQADKASGTTFTLHDGKTNITPPSGKAFSKWKDQDNNLYSGGATYTMPAKNVTLTAQWATACTVTYNANNGSGTMTDSNSPYASGATVTTKPNEFTRDGYVFTKWNTQAGGGGTSYNEGATFNISANTTLYAQWEATSVHDDLSRATTGISNGGGYGTWSGKSASNTGHSAAVYAGTSAGGNDAIQLRTTGSVEGVVTTAFGGEVKYVTVKWNGNTPVGRTIDIYGKNEAYSSAADLYSATAATQGTILGSIVCGTSTVLAVSGHYKYIGIRSKSDALYLTSISIVWTPIELSSIAITTQPNTRKYLAGETFSKTGAVVTATFSDASTKDVSASATWTPSGALTAETGKTVTASYTENGVTKTATTTIDVYSVSFTKQDEDDNAISDAGVTATANGRSIVAAVGSTNYYFKQWISKTASGTTISNTSNASTTLTGAPSGNVELIAVYYKPRVIEWKVNNETYTPGSSGGTNGSATVKYNTQWKSLTLPTDPDVSNYCGQKFAGWTTTDLEWGTLDKDDDADAITDLDLMTSENKSTKTTQKITSETTTFHAVFADYDE